MEFIKNPAIDPEIESFLIDFSERFQSGKEDQIIFDGDHFKSFIQEIKTKRHLTEAEVRKLIRNNCKKMSIFLVKELGVKNFLKIALEWSAGAVLFAIFKKPFLIGTTYYYYAGGGLINISSKKRVSLNELMEVIAKVSPTAQSAKELALIRHLIGALITMERV